VLYIVIESWLNAKSDNRTRGTVFSIYTAINLTVITIGQMMLGLASPASFSLFATASILISLAAIPIALTMSASPAPPDVFRLRVGKLYRISPVGVAGCFAVGLANGAFWALGPVFAHNNGFDMTGIAVFMSAVVLGGALLQWPLGSLSDCIDRRIVMVLAALIALSAALAVTLIPAPDKSLTILAAAIFGAGAFPLYALAVAHANDNASPSDYVEVSSGLLLVYGLGAAAGPLIASMSRQIMGVPTLFLFTAVVHAVLIGWVIWRISRREATPVQERVIFSDAAIAAQTVLHFDPAAPEAKEEDMPEALQPARC
jgi:predicted MFS family arabinose efflux permease